MSKQPDWKFIINLGDCHPLDHGGYFIFQDQTGVYAPEGVYTEPNDEEAEHHTMHRFILEPCTYSNGILSDNKCHPGLEAWFAKTEAQRKERPQDTTYLKDLADQFGASVDELAAMFCSDSLVERALAWREVGMYHGFDNLDHCPDKLTREELKAWMDKTGVEPRNKKL